MKQVASWIIAGSIAVSTGCTATPARAQQAPANPQLQEEAEFARARLEAEHAAVQAARADAQAARADAQAARERALAEVRGRLAEIRDGQNIRWVAGKEVKKEKVAHLGVSTSQVPAVMRQQMKLPRGFGLVVDSVGKDSAAEQGGIQQYDILMKFDDQKLVNTQQLSVLVRSMKAGDQVKLTLIRQGEPQEVTVTLQEKEVPVTGDGMWGFGSREGIADMMIDLAPLAEMPDIPIPPQAGRVEIAPDGRMNLFRVGGLADGDENVSEYTDSEMSLRITEKDDGKTLLARDAQDQTLFEGPIDTADQRAKLPAAVAEKLEKFEKRLEKMSFGDGKRKGIRVRVIEPGGSTK